LSLASDGKYTYTIDKTLSDLMVCIKPACPTCTSTPCKASVCSVSTYQCVDTFKSTSTTCPNDAAYTAQLVNGLDSGCNEPKCDGAGGCRPALKTTGAACSSKDGICAGSKCDAAGKCAVDYTSYGTTVDCTPVAAAYALLLSADGLDDGCNEPKCDGAGGCRPALKTTGAACSSKNGLCVGSKCDTGKCVVDYTNYGATVDCTPDFAAYAALLRADELTETCNEPKCNGAGSCKPAVKATGVCTDSEASISGLDTKCAQPVCSSGKCTKEAKLDTANHECDAGCYLKEYKYCIDKQCKEIDTNADTPVKSCTVLENAYDAV
jgi:hypothetical protein